VRYHVAPGRVATELILPAHREDRVRLVKGVADSFRDKAVSTALDRFTSHSTRIMQEAQRDDDLDPSRALARLARNPPPDLVPVVRFFGDRFAGTQLGPGERIVRQEVWYGLAPLPADADPGSERLEALRRYYAGPSLATAAPYPAAARYGATEREADIVWTLIYVHEP
jgi:hypothetical protein